MTGLGVALAFSYLFPVNPERAVERTACGVFEELGAVLDDWLRGLDEALSAGYEIARAPTRRRALKVPRALRER